MLRLTYPLASDDAGATLARLASSIDISIGTAIEYSADGSALYVTSNNTVYRSTDHGNSWLARGDIPSPPSGTHALIVDPADASRLYVTASDPGQAYQSADGGMTWQAWQAPGGIINRLRAPSNPQVVYMVGRSSSGAGNVMLRSADGGDTWTTYSHPGGNGGGSTSVFMIVALLLLSRLRAARNLRPRSPNPFS